MVMILTVVPVRSEIRKVPGDVQSAQFRKTQPVMDKDFSQQEKQTQDQNGRDQVSGRMNVVCWHVTPVQMPYQIF